MAGDVAVTPRNAAVVLLMVVVASWVVSTAIDTTGVGRGLKKFL